MKEAINTIIKNQEKNTHNLDDKNIYIKDGLKHCSICNKALETYLILPWANESKKVGCICKCKADMLRKQEEEERQRKKQKEIENLQKQSLLGSRYLQASFETCFRGKNVDFDNAFIRCKKYCEVSNKVLEEGYGIYIFGDKGTGKTHITACMVNELVKQGNTVLFTNFFEISKMIRSTFNRTNSSENEMSFINKIANIDFLFIDDIGSEILKKNDEDTWLQGVVFDVINKRYNNKKPTVFTSNHSLQELITKRGIMTKTVDRILEMSNLILKIEGASYRPEARQKELPF